MILCVGLSPAVDVTYRVARLTAGSTTRVDAVVRRPGGKATNVARVLHALSVPTHLLTPVGGPAGEEFAASLPALPATLVPDSAPTRTTVTVVEDDATATVLNEPAVLGCWPELLHAATALVGQADVVVISGRLPGGAPTDAFGTLVRLARNAGRPVVVDTSGEALREALAARPTVIKPNTHELDELAGPGCEEPAVAAARLAVTSGTAVIASLGPDGAVAANGAGAWHASVTPVRGNPTGAGDALVAGIAGALRRDPTALTQPAELLRDAVALGAAAVQAATAGEVDLAHYAAHRGNVRVRELSAMR